MQSEFQRIRPFLWFDNQAEEAVKFYTSFFENSKIHKITRYDEESAKAAGVPNGSVMTVEFQLEGRQFLAVNGGPDFKFNQTESFVIYCESEEDVDFYWERLTEAADVKDVENLWLKDKYGVSWQIIPEAVIRLSEDPEQDKAQRFMNAMFHQKKMETRKAA